jgi:S-adenosylmethionine-diacylglycerol 3-amino-3-carboxypropyl transferase
LRRDRGNDDTDSNSSKRQHFLDSSAGFTLTGEHPASRMCHQYCLSSTTRARCAFDEDHHLSATSCAAAVPLGVPPKTRPTLVDRLDQRIFNALWSSSLVYNTCWEDPRVDRRALQIGADDHLLVITSAGCNALDYLLDAPARVYAIDANPRQNALLELKVAGIRKLPHEDFFKIFGTGLHPEFSRLYREQLRPEISPFARRFWDRRCAWFEGRRGSFYFNGLAGTVARAFHAYLRLRPKLRTQINALFEAASLEEQRAIYDQKIAPILWGPALRWTLSRQFTMSMLGVPHPQTREVEAQHSGGVSGFIRESLEYVMRELPLRDNYFYGVYLRGHYTPECCPGYLRKDEFERLQGGLIDRLEIHTGTVTHFLQDSPHPISRFVLLDHMDWMSSYHPEALMEEWDAILARATPGARAILRSAHARPSYLDWVQVGPEKVALRTCLTFREELARELTRQDRVHTYAGFHIVDLPK